MYSQKSNLFHCTNYSKYDCLVKNCKTCQKNNNYFCEICNPPYEPDSITGSCMKRNEKIPSIIWKAIYGLKTNQIHSINGKNYYGPSLILRGITISQINEGHTFSFYLSFELEKLFRNLQNIEKIKKVPMICEITEGVDESEDEVKIVEYNCFGNITQDESEELTFENSDTFKIEEDYLKNIGKLMPCNLDDMNLSDIREENHISQFSLAQFLKTSIFSLNETKNQTSNSYNFIFTLKGKIKGNLDSNGINEALDIYFDEIDKKDKCNLIIEKNKTASLNCNINLTEYSNYSVFSFKVSNYEDNNNIIDLSLVNNIYLNKLSEEKKEGKDNTLLYILLGAGAACLILIISTIILCGKNRNDKRMIQNLKKVRFNPKVKNHKMSKLSAFKKINKKLAKKEIKNKNSKNSNIASKYQKTTSFESSKRQIALFNRKKNNNIV